MVQGKSLLDLADYEKLEVRIMCSSQRIVIYEDGSYVFLFNRDQPQPALQLFRVVELPPNHVLLGLVDDFQNFIEELRDAATRPDVTDQDLADMVSAWANQ